MKKRLNGILLSVADEAISKENIIGYLNIVKNNPTLSAFNHCMIYLQKPDAQILCRRGTWERKNREVKPNVKPIVFMYPRITLKAPAQKHLVDGKPQVVAGTDVAINHVQAQYQCNYDAVNVFDVADTISKTEPEEAVLQTPEISFADRIFELTEVTPECADISGISNYQYDEKNRTLYYSYDLNTDDGKKKYNQMIVDFFIEYYLPNIYKVNDKMLKCAIKYIIYERYGIKHRIMSASFGQLNKYSIEEKLQFIFNLQYLVNGIVQSLEGYSLTFDETFFIKNLLYDISDLETSAIVTIDGIAESVDDVVVKRELAAFRGKLMVMDENSLFQVIEKSKTGEMSIYPPEAIEIKDKSQERVLFEALQKIS